MHSPRIRHVLVVLCCMTMLAALPAGADAPRDVGPTAGTYCTESICVRYWIEDSLVAGAHVRMGDGTYIDAVTDGLSCPSKWGDAPCGGLASVLSLPDDLVVCRNRGTYDINVGYDPVVGWIYEPGFVANHLENPEHLSSLYISGVVQDANATFWVGRLVTDIQGTVWQDANGNGSREGDEGLASYDVQAFLWGTPYRRATTSSDGSYHLAIFESGTYQIRARRTGQEAWQVETQLLIGPSVTDVTPLDLEIVIQPTLTPSATPTTTPTPEPGAVQVHGVASDGDGDPVGGMVAHIARNAGGWLPVQDSVSGSDGVFRAWLSPITGQYRIVADPPAGWTMASAALPEGVTGEVIGARHPVAAAGPRRH